MNRASTPSPMLPFDADLNGNTPQSSNERRRIDKLPGKHRANPGLRFAWSLQRDQYEARHEAQEVLQ